MVMVRVSVMTGVRVGVSKRDEVDTAETRVSATTGFRTQSLRGLAAALPRSRTSSHKREF